MTTRVKLFLSMKNESVARPLGLRRMRRAPGRGQRFDIAVDGRSVSARITHCSSATWRVAGSPILDVYAVEE
jgi:hypothetical protein